MTDQELKEVIQEIKNSTMPIPTEIPILLPSVSLGMAPIITPIESPIMQPKNSVRMIAGYLFPKSTPRRVM